MDRKTKKIMCYKALDEMNRRLNAYKSKPNPNLEYLTKSYGYLQSIKNYISSLEDEIVDAKFNADVFVVNDDHNTKAQLREAKKRNGELLAMLDAVGVDPTTQRHMMPDMPEMKRQRNINKAKQTWPELY